jgi:hypothetical protein
MCRARVAAQFNIRQRQHRGGKMMSTRENMRRELKELARLAETMGKERTSDSWHPADERPSSPPGLSSVSVPPVVPPSIPPPVAASVPVEVPFRNRKRGGVLAVVVGASLAAALMGGAVLGRSFAPHPVAAAAAANPPPPAETPLAIPTAPSLSAIVAAHGVADPQPDPVEPPAAVAVPTPNAGAAAPPPAKRRGPTSVAAPRHASKAPPPAIAAPATPAAPAAAALPAAAKPAAAAANIPAAPAPASDSLDDMIRKAVAATPAKK